MNILLWVLQILLALHTIMGAVWKFSNSQQTVVSLKAIPHGMWLSFGVIELICSLFLLLPIISKKLSVMTPFAAGFIALEMLFYCMYTIFAGTVIQTELIYWFIVFVISAFIAYGRYAVKPL